MAQISRRRLAQTIVRLLHKQPTWQTQILRSVAAYLIESKQTKQLDLLVQDIARELENEGQLFAEVHSAFSLDATSRSTLVQYLKQATSSKTVTLDESVDPQLLSGMVVRTADKELDTTARRQLRRLANLTSGGNK
jgi:ATP synthase F1 delta subunit